MPFQKLHSDLIFFRGEFGNNINREDANDVGETSSSQKQSRQQLDKRYQSIRKTIASNGDGSVPRNSNLGYSIFGTFESEGSPVEVAEPSCIMPERQRELLIQVLLLHRGVPYLIRVNIAV